ncbi:hypothetical protein RRG08_021653 [Elysia crispata]|uniref:Uncharacterized protein n=1 Tax=Elysia crispata TaxID=231223 RepID=A0AAE1CEG5_9GAST|nr:hypothetical protein RRG08_021653 [Elysia crispata]
MRCCTAQFQSQRATLVVPHSKLDYNCVKNLCETGQEGSTPTDAGKISPRHVDDTIIQQSSSKHPRFLDKLSDLMTMSRLRSKPAAHNTAVVDKKRR